MNKVEIKIYNTKGHRGYNVNNRFINWIVRLFYNKAANQYFNKPALTPKEEQEMEDNFKKFKKML